MKKLFALLPLLVLSPTAQSSTAYGALSNFDAVNDTGQIAYGFEIEIDGIHSTAVGGTYSWNHYGVPKIREDNSNAANPKVFIRYEATSPSGFTTGFTNVPTGAIAPTSGHSCTNPAVNDGCEHFGVGVYSAGATAYKYNWLVKDATGKVVLGPAVNVGAPVYTYQPPVFAPPVIIPVPNLPPIVQQPAVVQFAAQVVAVIPAPVVPIPQSDKKRFGEPSWVKVIKTTAHKERVLALEELVGEDKDGDDHPDWTNGVPDEVESEWYLLQTNNKGKDKKAELASKADDIGDGRENVTRRYEFYEYAGPAETIDGENGEAMCDTVQTDPDNQDGIPEGNGIGTVDVTLSNGGSIKVDCSQYKLVGAYRGAQMGEFNAIAPLSLINDIQSGNVRQAFPQRSVVFGGNTPYKTTLVAGKLPDGLRIDSETGVLSGVPAKVGIFNFTVEATDTDGSVVNNIDKGGYAVKITGPGDVDGDFDIDSADLAVIKAKYGQNALRTDPANLNGDLKINLLDYRKAALLCTKPRCALVTP
jgi:hypothetical protein